MVRNYRKPDNSRKYTVVSGEALKKCLEKVEAGEMTHTELNCSRQTVYNKLNGLHKCDPSHHRIFTEAEEASFVDHLSILSEWGFPVGLDDFREVIRIYLAKQNRSVPIIKNNKPSQNLVERFLHDHQELSKSFAQNIKLSRAAITRETIDEYMANLKISLDGIPAANVFNYDEINLLRTFENWFKSLFLMATKHLKGQIALIEDNLSSHLNPSVINICQQRGIRFICLPPNATHLTQPLDVAFFGPMKRESRKILGRWRASREGSKNATIPKSRLGSLINELSKAMAPQTRRILVSGFRKCGIVPLNPHELLSQLPSVDVKIDLVGESFKEFLKEHRNDVVGCPAGPQPKKKLKVSPDKSVSPDEIAKKDPKPKSAAPAAL